MSERITEAECWCGHGYAEHFDGDGKPGWHTPCNRGGCPCVAIGGYVPGDEEPERYLVAEVRRLRGIIVAAEDDVLYIDNSKETGGWEALEDEAKAIRAERISDASGHASIIYGRAPHEPHLGPLAGVDTSAITRVWIDGRPFVPESTGPRTGPSRKG